VGSRLCERLGDVVATSLSLPVCTRITVSNHTAFPADTHKPIYRKALLPNMGRIADERVSATQEEIVRYLFS
jgi:hypothetical protein